MKLNCKVSNYLFPLPFKKDALLTEHVTTQSEIIFSLSNRVVNHVWRLESIHSSHPNIKCVCVPPFLSSGAAFHFICDLPLHLHKWYYWVTHCIIHLEKKPFLIFQVIFLLTLYFDSLTLSHCGKLEFLGIFLAWVILNFFNWIILVYKLGYKILKLKSK